MELSLKNLIIDLKNWRINDKRYEIKNKRVNLCTGMNCKITNLVSNMRGVTKGLDMLEIERFTY